MNVTEPLVLVVEDEPQMQRLLRASLTSHGYRTLEGHFERGQIDFTIHKNITSGAVQFRIHAVSQAGQIRNPFYWLGFKLFGRTLQRRFARESLRRMQALVAAELLKTSRPQTLPVSAG